MPKSVRTEALANVFQICLSASAAAANVAMQPPAIAKASDTHTHTVDTRTHTHTHTGTATVAIAVELPCWVRCVAASTSSLCPFPSPVLSCWRLIIYAETRFQRPLICPLWIETVRRDRRTDGQLLIYILPETS